MDNEDKIGDLAACNATANKLAGHLGLLDLPQNEKTSVILELCYNRIVEAGYLFAQGIKVMKGNNI